MPTESEVQPGMLTDGRTKKKSVKKPTVKNRYDDGNTHGYQNHVLRLLTDRSPSTIIKVSIEDPTQLVKAGDLAVTGDTFKLSRNVLTNPGKKIEISFVSVKLAVEGKFTTPETPNSGLVVLLSNPYVWKCEPAGPWRFFAVADMKLHRDLRFVLKQNSQGGIQEAVYFSSFMEPALMAWVMHRGDCTEFLVLCQCFLVLGGRGGGGEGGRCRCTPLAGVTPRIMLQEMSFKKFPEGLFHKNYLCCSLTESRVQLLSRGWRVAIS